MSPRSATIISRAREWYARYERPLSSISLIGGFVFDALTLRRVDVFWDNVWVVGHFVIVMTCALLINLIENTEHNEENPQRIHFWLVNIMQFFFGGIFSTFLVFYFRSGSITASWPFLVLLAAAFIANESLKRHYARLAFQIALLFISIYAFAIYILPIIFHRIGTDMFIWSGVVSVAIILLFVLVLAKFSREKFKGWVKWFVVLGILGITAAVNILYFYNFIPPLPLSLKDADIYQSLIVNGPGNYTVEYEDQGPWAFFHWNETIHITPGSPLYAYTAVFSPTSLNTSILHVWQYYDPNQGWVTRGRIPLAVSGGFDSGYRTYSVETGITAGEWRVNAETPKGQVIGQIRFNVILTTSTPTLGTLKID